MNLSKHRLILPLAAMMIITACVAQSWMIKYESSDNYRADIFQLVEDSDKNAYVVGNTTTRDNSRTAFVAKYSPSGELLWNYEIDNFRVFAEGHIKSDVIVIDTANDIYLSFFRNDDLTQTKLIKLSSDGELQWEYNNTGDFSAYTGLHITEENNLIASFQLGGVLALSDEGDTLWRYNQPGTGAGVAQELARQDPPKQFSRTIFADPDQIEILDEGINRVRSTANYIYVARENSILVLNHQGELVQSKSTEDLGVDQFFDLTLKDGRIGISSATRSSSAYGPTYFCLLYTSPSPRDRTRSRMPSSA